MTDLRDKVALVVAGELGQTVRSPRCYAMADAVLAIPEIREALALVPVNRKVIGGRDE